MHVDENLAQLAVTIFAGPQIDLVTADDGLLRVALAPLGQLFAATGDFLDDDFLDDLLGDHGGFLLRRSGLEDVHRLVIILDQRRCQRLAEFGAVTVERIGFDAKFPAQLVGFLAVFNRRIIGHIDRLGDRARDEALGGGHHIDVAVNPKVTLAFLAARVGAIKDVVMRGVQMRGTFQRHRAANMVIRRLDIRFRVTQMAQQVERGIVQLVRRNAEHVLAEFAAERPLVEHEADIESRPQRALHLFDLARAEAVADQAGRVDARCVADAAMTDGIGHDLLDLGRAVAQFLQCGGHGMVDDLEISAACELFELHQCEIRLDAGRVAIHHQTDGACGGNHGRLGVAIAVLFAKAQRLVPRGFRQLDQTLVGAVGVIQRHRLGGQCLVAVRCAVSGVAVVTDDAQHMFAVALVAVECPKLARHFGGRGIGHAGHDRGQCTGHRTALVAVITKAHVHQQTADIGIAQTQRAEFVRQLRDFLGRELRHRHRDFQRQRPQTRGMHIVFDLKFAVLVKGQQVHRGQIAGSIVKEHVFRARVGAADRAVFGAGVPVVDRVVILDARIGAGPCGVADVFPQIARLDRLGDRAIGAADQFPIGVILDSLEERIGHTHRIVGVLAGDRGIGLAVPIGVIGREFDGAVALLGIIQHAFDVGLGDHDLFRAADRILELRVLCGIYRIFGAAVPCLDRGKDRVQLLLVHFGACDDAGNLLLFFHLPVDVFLNIGVIRIDDHHLGRAARGAARFDRARCTVPDLEETHQA